MKRALRNMHIKVFQMFLRITKKTIAFKLSSFLFILLKKLLEYAFEPFYDAIEYFLKE